MTFTIKGEIYIEHQKLLLIANVQGKVVRLNSLTSIGFEKKLMQVSRERQTNHYHNVLVDTVKMFEKQGKVDLHQERLNVIA